MQVFCKTETWIGNYFFLLRFFILIVGLIVSATLVNKHSLAEEISISYQPDKNIINNSNLSGLSNNINSSRISTSSSSESSSLTSATPGRELPPYIRAQLLKEIAEFKREHKLTSLSVAISFGGKLAWSKSLGLAQVGENFHSAKKATPQTIYRIASVSKTIAALAIMKLVEQGKINLQDPVSKYIRMFWDQYPSKLDHITIYHILTHTSGLRHYKYSEGEKENALPITDRRQAINMYHVLDEPLKFNPGDDYCYSSYGYILLKHIVEMATINEYKDYQDFLKQQIFRPAGMTRTGVDDPDYGIQIEARPYRLAKNISNNNHPQRIVRWQEAPYVNVIWKQSAGGLASTVIDLINLSIALDEGKIVSYSTLNKIYTPVTLPNGKSTGYGLGVHVFPVKEHELQTATAATQAATPPGPATTGTTATLNSNLYPYADFWVGHAGGATGGAAYLLRNPVKRIAVAALTNLQIKPALLGELAARLAKKLVPSMPNLKID